ncbi:MAG: hypothetical protein KF739_12060 [Cryobacterium sp.]|nr:hypothetical protein [Cryobacterium sp.]
MAVPVVAADRIGLPIVTVGQGSPEGVFAASMSMPTTEGMGTALLDSMLDGGFGNYRRRTGS